MSGRGETLAYDWLKKVAGILLVVTWSCGGREANMANFVDARLVAGHSEQAILSAVACSDCVVTGTAPVALPLTGRSFTAFKLASVGKRTPYSVALDSNGNVVDSPALLHAEAVARFARQGRLRDDAYVRAVILL